MSERWPAAWLAEHQGPLLRITGRVWWCGDDYCGCSQAQIAEVYANRVVPRAIIPMVIWEGEFHIGHEPGAEAELAAKRDEMKAEDPALADRIEWALE